MRTCACVRPPCMPLLACLLVGRDYARILCLMHAHVTCVPMHSRLLTYALACIHTCRRAGRQCACVQAGNAHVARRATCMWIGARTRAYMHTHSGSRVGRERLQARAGKRMHRERHVRWRHHRFSARLLASGPASLSHPAHTSTLTHPTHADACAHMHARRRVACERVSVSIFSSGCVGRRRSARTRARAPTLGMTWMGLRPMRVMEASSSDFIAILCTLTRRGR